MEELARLKREPINDEELNRAKNILKINILMAMERREERLEEVARNYMTFGRISFQDYISNIEKVTSKQINNLASEFLVKKPSMVIIGPHASDLPSVKDI